MFDLLTTSHIHQVQPEKNNKKNLRQITLFDILLTGLNDHIALIVYVVLFTLSFCQ